MIRSRHQKYTIGVKKEKVSYEKVEIAINKSIATKVDWASALTFIDPLLLGKTDPLYAQRIYTYFFIMGHLATVKQ